jgi:1-acyl-sn-glycerol-3-phosphate acyltransferase
MADGPIQRPNVSRAVTVISRAVVPLIASVEIDDLDIIPEHRKGVIIAANHRSLFDLVVGLIAFRHWRIRPYVLVREDLFEMPVAGWLLRSVGGIPAGPKHGVKALMQSLRLLDNGGIVIVMPEGRVPREAERVDGLADLMPGVGRLASAKGTPVLLVGLVNTDVAWPPGSAMPQFHLRKSRRPRILISADWLRVDKGTAEAEVMTAISGGLRAVLRRLPIDNSAT